MDTVRTPTTTIQEIAKMAEDLLHEDRAQSSRNYSNIEPSDLRRRIQAVLVESPSGAISVDKYELKKAVALGGITRKTFLEYLRGAAISVLGVAVPVFVYDPHERGRPAELVAGLRIEKVPFLFEQSFADAWLNSLPLHPERDAYLWRTRQMLRCLLGNRISQGLFLAEEFIAEPVELPRVFPWNMPIAYGESRALFAGLAWDTTCSLLTKVGRTFDKSGNGITTPREAFAQGWWQPRKGDDINEARQFLREFQKTPIGFAIDRLKAGHGFLKSKQVVSGEIITVADGRRLTVDGCLEGIRKLKKHFSIDDFKRSPELSRLFAHLTEVAGLAGAQLPDRQIGRNPGAPRFKEARKRLRSGLDGVEQWLQRRHLGLAARAYATIATYDGNFREGLKWAESSITILGGRFPLDECLSREIQIWCLSELRMEREAIAASADAIAFVLEKGVEEYRALRPLVEAMGNLPLEIPNSDCRNGFRLRDVYEQIKEAVRKHSTREVGAKNVTARDDRIR